MNDVRRIAILGALLGAFASAYLLVDYGFGSGICLTGSGCDVVRASPVAYPLGIPMPLLGLGFYAVAVGFLLADPGRMLFGRSMSAVTLGWSLLGVSVMAALTAYAAIGLRATCSWCLMSAVGSVLLAVGAFIAWRRGAAAPLPEPTSSRARRRAMAESDRSRTSVRRFAGMTATGLGAVLVALLALPALTAGTPPATANVAASLRPQTGAGPVEVVVFSDFQCPACAIAAPILSDLAEGGEITLTYRYFPLADIHPNATLAAEAAEAAARQGAFWNVHDALFAQQAAWASLPGAEALSAFEAIAAEAGVDVARWRADLTNISVRDVVAQDRRMAEDLSLSGTPSIFVDGVRYGGRLTPADLAGAVRDAAGR
jgi:protein-disulfide isomerase/uncharacterized membrane protein